ncbi:hypothetical protein [Haliscomenobacter sp.]|uniref:hypothetical protein n=1 Tax=Haliscomenobacter sp. TaxID=2717303 RepID=UPI003BAAA05D
MRKLLTTSLGGLWASVSLALFCCGITQLHAQQNHTINPVLLDFFSINDDRVCEKVRPSEATHALFQQAYLLNAQGGANTHFNVVKKLIVPFGENLILEEDYVVYSEGDVRIDGNIFGKSIVQSNRSGQNLIICAAGTIEINGNIQLSDGGPGYLSDKNFVAQIAPLRGQLAQIGAVTLGFSVTNQVAQSINGGRGGSLFLQAPRIIINGQVKVGKGGNGIAGGRGGEGGSMIILYKQFQAGRKTNRFVAGNGGQGGNGEAWFNIDGGAGGKGGETYFFACSNGSNGSNGAGSPTTVGENGGNGGQGGNSSDGIACGGGNGGNGGSGGVNLTTGNGRRGGSGGNGGDGGVAFNTVPGGSAFAGNGGQGGNGAQGGNGFGADKNGGNGGQGGDGGAGGFAIGADGSTGGSCATTTGGDATGGNGGDGGPGGAGGFGTGAGIGGNGGRGGARGAGGDGTGGSAGSCTAVACSTPQGGTGIGGTRGARGAGGPGGTSGVGGTTGANGNQGSNVPTNGTGTDGNDGVCILPIELTQFEAKLQDQGIMVTWTTATELNNDYMALERSANGQNFLEITRVKGKGTTQETQHYQYFDPNPLAGINYYRLRQVDFNGTTDHSKVVAVTLDKGELMSIFPNPAKDRINIQTSLTLLAEEVFLLDALGRKISLNLQGSPGWYEIKLPAELPAGNYWLRLQDRAQIHRMVVVRE